MSELNIGALKFFLAQHGYTEAQFAKKIGVTRSFVNRVLNGDRKPGFKFITGFCQAFPDYPIDAFFIPTLSPNGDTKNKHKEEV